VNIVRELQSCLMRKLILLFFKRNMIQEYREPEKEYSREEADKKEKREKHEKDLSNLCDFEIIWDESGFTSGAGFRKERGE